MVMVNGDFDGNAAIAAIPKIMDWYDGNCDTINNRSYDCQANQDVSHLTPPFRSSVVFFGKDILTPREHKVKSIKVTRTANTYSCKRI
jgi:hypothetical protein